MNKVSKAQTEAERRGRESGIKDAKNKLDHLEQRDLSEWYKLGRWEQKGYSQGYTWKKYGPGRFID